MGASDTTAAEEQASQQPHVSTGYSFFFNKNFIITTRLPAFSFFIRFSAFNFETLMEIHDRFTIFVVSYSKYAAHSN